MATRGGGTLAALPEDAEVDDDRLPSQFAAGGAAVADSMIPLDQLEILEQIGEGAFSKVYRGRLRGNEVAVKKQVMAEKDAEKYLYSELAILKWVQRCRAVLRCAAMACCCVAY
jgi:hypothetical protein